MQSSSTDSPDIPYLAEQIFSRYVDIVDDWDALMAALRRPLPVTLWANPLRLTRDELMPLLARQGLHAAPIGWNAHGLRLAAGARPGLHWGFLVGLFRIQEEVSMLPVQLLDPQPGERVLDLCAAPGNKTAQIAVAMNNRGTVVSNDLKRNRIAAIRQSVKRLGLMNVAVTVRDGQGFDQRAGIFDRVLVDAPCTCEGTFRKVRIPQVVETVIRERTVRVQTNLLRRAVQLTRPGGRIVYSTCTLAPEENEGVVDTIVREMGGAVRLLPARVAGFPASAGIRHWQGRKFHPDIAHCLRVWPHQQDTGGFFVAVLEKDDGGMPTKDVAPFMVPDAGLEWLQPFTERLGMPRAVFDHIRPVKRGRRHIHFVALEQAFPQAPTPDLLGLPAVRCRSLPLKPTTAAILLLGHHATRNVVDLDDAQAGDYLQRVDATLRLEQLAGCTGPGYAVARYQGQVLGLGQLIYHRDDPGVHLVSLLPKAWARDTADLDPEEYISVY
ncbi:MAG: RsmB/NOP family class I SAM-dependent RNA methyltransferase [Aquisalimonadaceae bacterium]